MYTTHIILGVLLAIAFIITVTFFVLHKTKDLLPQDKILFMLIFLLSLVSCVWAVDKCVAIHTEILTTQESDSVFEIIKSIVFTILGYYFATKNTPNQNI
jgi:hypothetical protein